jgi:hypothetical protein
VISNIYQYPATDSCFADSAIGAGGMFAIMGGMFAMALCCACCFLLPGRFLKTFSAELFPWVGIHNDACFVSVLALIIWILATSHEVRTLPCASEEFNDNHIGNIWDYCVFLLVLCGPLQLFVGGMVAHSGSGKNLGKMAGIGHMVAALVQVPMLVNYLSSIYE